MPRVCSLRSEHPRHTHRRALRCRKPTGTAGIKTRIAPENRHQATQSPDAQKTIRRHFSTADDAMSANSLAAARPRCMYIVVGTIPYENEHTYFYLSFRRAMKQFVLYTETRFHIASAPIRTGRNAYGTRSQTRRAADPRRRGRSGQRSLRRPLRNAPSPGHRRRLEGEPAGRRQRRRRQGQLPSSRPAAGYLRNRHRQQGL